jgi:hypothetical protein
LLSLVFLIISTVTNLSFNDNNNNQGRRQDFGSGGEHLVKKNFLPKNFFSNFIKISEKILKNFEKNYT